MTKTAAHAAATLLRRGEVWLFSIEQTVRTNQQLMKQRQDREGDHECDPSLRFMEPAFGKIRIKLRRHAGDRDPSRVLDDSDRNCGEEQRYPHPHTFFREVTVDQ